MIRIVSTIGRRFRVTLWRVRKNPWRCIGYAAIVLFIATILSAIVANSFFEAAFSSLGEFGDFVGGIANPMLALLGLMALLYTIRLQSSELALSRNELALTRQELGRSAVALEQQVNHLERQQLSRSFFDLFEMYKSVVSELEHGPKDNRKKGKGALESKAIEYAPYSFYSQEGWSIQDVLKIHSDQNEDLGNYFRIIFRLMTFLAEKGRNAEFFADMFRAQLTTSEFHLLFFNCISDVGSPMEEFAVRFELFDNMPIPSGDGFENVACHIDRRSFGQNKDLHSLVD